jgi:sugar-specific transcriptional regulator TrmB
MDTQTLKEIGLTDNEIKIYLFLLKNGNSTTGPIIKKTQIANSRVYESLNSLISKGILTFNSQKDGKHFQAQGPEIFLEKQKELKERLENFIPELKKIKTKEEKEIQSAIYQGIQGFKTAFKKIIEDCPEKETIYIIGFPNQIYKIEQLKLFIANMNLKSASKKQKLKILLEQSTKETLGKEREREKYTEIKYMPKGYISPIAMDIFQDHVYIFIWEENPTVFMIKNKKVAESFKTYHNFLWKIAKP